MSSPVASCVSVEPTLPMQPVLQPQHLPSQPLYGRLDAAEPSASFSTPGWQLSPTPFVLTQAQVDEITVIGQALWAFWQAADVLYRDSASGKRFAWIADYIDRGKPEALRKFAMMKRFKNRLPQVIRPDLLLTDDGFALCEVDSVPGGLGFTSALNQAYYNSGFSSIIQPQVGMPQAFLKLLQSPRPDLENPVIALVVSDEASDYRAELQWLVDSLAGSGASVHLVHPTELELVRERLVIVHNNGTETPVDVIYRFFELFDLPNIPKIELIQYAIKKGWAACTPPFAFHLEEKLWLALLHHPVLENTWQTLLGAQHFECLLKIVPPSWIVDPRPLPPHATIANLAPAGLPVQHFSQLFELSKAQRQLVLKPSGFSPLAWGSKGVTVGHDVPQTEWKQALEVALNSFERSPYLLQQFKKPRSHPLSRMDLLSGEIKPFRARTRLCPYFFAHSGAAGSNGETVELAGILATSCPADKKVIHGMVDAVLAPCSVMAE